MKSLWIQAHRKTIANQREIRAGSSETQLFEKHERAENHSNRILDRIGQFQRIRFWRKIYERTAEVDTGYSLDGYFISSQTNCKDDVFLTNMSLVWKDFFCYKMDYLHPCETGRNFGIKVSPEMLKTIWNHFMPPSSVSSPILNVHLSGSNFEGLDVPPTMKDVQMQENEDTVTLIEQCDTDVMLVMGGISLGLNSCDVAATPADGIVETEGTRHGFLRILLSEHFLRQNSEKLAHYIDYPYLKNNYFEMFNNYLKALFEKFTVCQEKTARASILTVGIKGPAFNVCSKVLTSITPEKHSRYLLTDCDIVFALQFTKWPSVAKEWPARKRRFGWPSSDLIERIKSYGSYVVATSHDVSDKPDIEFRFSFSIAEHLLAEELSFEQKQCYVSFKSVIKRVKQELERVKQIEVKVKSYHLKNVFFWVCETIPAEEFQSPSGWLKCFLFLIDQLLYCLREKNLPGYFIPQYNLWDAVSSDVLESLDEKVSALSSDPFSTVTDFLNTLVLYNGLQLNKVLYTQTEMTDMRWGLEVIQNLIFAFNENSKCRFWKKSCALQIFSHWCKSHFPSSLSHCISSKMTLFDIVYLDITHQFELDISLLKEFADRETSADVVSKLASCYVEAGNGTSHRDSYYGKAELLFTLSGEKSPSLSNVIAFSSFLHDSAKYEEALIVLKSATEQAAGRKTDNIFEEAQKVHSLMEAIGEEIGELEKYGTKYLPAAVPVYYLSLKCYRQLSMREAEDSLLKEFELFCNQLEKCNSQLSWYVLGILQRRIGKISPENEYLRKALNARLLQGSIKHERVLVEYSRKCPHAMISVQYLFFMLSMLMPNIGTPAQFKELIEDQQMLVHNMPFTGSNLSKITFLLINGHWTPSENEEQCLTHNLICASIIKWSAMSNSPTLSNKLYYSQFLMNCTTGQPALPILLDVVQKAKTNPLSVVVWPKKLKSSVDDHIRRELDSVCEDGCIIIPTIVYGHYLLATLYLRLKQMTEYTQVMFEFQSICQDLESVYPFSYSLLGYAYEQSGRYPQAVISHRRARELLPNSELIHCNLSNAIVLEQNKTPVKQSTSTDRSRLIQEKGSEAMWQMYSGLLSTVPDVSMLENSVEMMKSFETGRTVDECYSCRLAD